MIRASLVRPAVVGLFAAGIVACGTVLGLGDYQNAPGDAGSNDAHQSGSGDVGTGPVSETGVESGEDARDDVELDAGSESAPDGESLDAPDLDAVALDATGLDAAMDVGSGLDGGFVVPPGWGVIAFASSPQTGCPSGFSANPLSVVFGSETAAAGACTCDSCSVSTQPSCVVGQINGGYDNNGSRSCSTVSQALANAAPGGCNTDNPHVRLFSSDVEWVPPGPANGACTSAPTAHPNQVTFSGQGLACSPEADAGSGCYDGGVCAPTLPSPFTLCVRQSGDFPCPAGPFTVAYHVGSGASVSCSGTCSCTVGATCANGTVTYYRDNGCANPTTLVMPANGTCNASNGGGNTFYSYIYSATVENVTCTPAASSTVTNLDLANEQTICCAP